MNDKDQLIRARAHEIWEREGRPHGREAEHWEKAKTEIEREFAAASKLPETSMKRTTARSKAPKR